jgi:hypothetical protein
MISYKLLLQTLKGGGWDRAFCIDMGNAPKLSFSGTGGEKTS